MTTTFIRRAVMCAGILALFLSLVGQPVMAKSKKSAPDIVEVQTTFGSDPGVGTCFPADDTITIIGENLTRKIEPVVFLGDEGPLTVCFSSPTQVVVQCPSGICREGDFRLTLMTDKKGKRFDVYDLTIGAVGPQGPEGDTGEKGDKGDQGKLGPQGNRGETGADGATGPPGDTGDPGQAGQDGAPGLSCWDLNGNNSCDGDEDTNEDGICDTKDCQGDSGLLIALCDLYADTSSAPFPLICQNCGNGILEPLDECDDGNKFDGDGCSSTCTPEGEECTTDADCNQDANLCTFNACLQGICVNQEAAVGSPCGSIAEDACDFPDTCDVGGVCSPNYAPNNIQCGPGAFCDGLGVCEESCSPSTEVCDGIDNDCDGLIDGDGLCGAFACFGANGCATNCGLGPIPGSGSDSACAAGFECNDATVDQDEFFCVSSNPTEFPCSTDNDCDVGFSCFNGSCGAKLPIGANCASGTECESDVCGRFGTCQ